MDNFFVVKHPTFAAMRTSAFVLAFILLALGFMPCADGGYAMKLSKEKIGIVKSPSEKTNSTDNDLCPPFCHCSCCANASINACFTSIDSPPQVQLKKVPSYLPGDVIEISLPIWQPPQLIA